MKLMLVVLMFASGFRNLDAQSPVDSTDSLSVYLKFDESSSFGILLPYLPPFFFQYGIELKTFIRSKTFWSIRNKFGDLRAIDAIYVRALNLTNNNTSVALLISTIACFDHRTIGLKIPVFALFFPLTDEPEREFRKRIRNLPKKLYSDTPPFQTGDRDKLQHFFGSAFIANTFESRQTAERFSEFIEKGEDAIIIGGTNDDRDRRANRQGQRFGMALLKNNHRLPSGFFAVDKLIPIPVIKKDSVKTSGVK